QAIVLEIEKLVERVVILIQLIDSSGDCFRYLRLLSTQTTQKLIDYGLIAVARQNHVRILRLRRRKTQKTVGDETEVRVVCNLRRLRQRDRQRPRRQGEPVIE